MVADISENPTLLITVCVSGVGGFFLLCYVTASILCYMYPTLCHKKRSFCKISGRICSFRGGGGEALEGSATALKHSVSLGASLFLPVRRTRDGEIIVYPDETFTRCCGISRRVEDTLLKNLPPYRPPFFLRYEKGSYSCGESEPIVTLVEVFKSFPETGVILDVKGRAEDDTLISGIARLIGKHKREALTVWGSHDVKLSNALNKKNPFIPLWTNPRRRNLLLLLHYIGMLPFTTIRESLYLTPMPLFVLDKQRGYQFSYMRGWKVWLEDKIVMSGTFIRHLRARGIPTYMYCLNQPHEYRRAFRVGVTGVVTDFPERLSDYLDQVDHDAKKERTV